MLNAFTAAVSPSVKRALALRPTLFTSLNTNMRSILFYAHSYSILCRFNLLVGLSGLEPPTSRLSGVRSNRLSYKPISWIRGRCPAPCTLILLDTLLSWWRWTGSNRWPPACKAGALPAELHPHILLNIGHLSSVVLPILFPVESSFSPFWKESEVWVTKLPMYMLCMYYRAFKIKQHLQIKLRNSWPWMLKVNLGSLYVSIERRWSSRTFRYGYLVTTSPQSPILPSTASSLRLDYWLRVLPAPMVWRAVCTRPGNVFTAACWSAITSNSNFM